MPNSSIILQAIPEPQHNELGVIPDAVTTNERIKEDADFIVNFSFKDYNSGECQVSKLSDKTAKQVMTKLKDVSGKPLPKFKEHLEPIEYKGEYKKIFHGLSPDVEMYEIKCSGDKRVFGHLTSYIFNITAVRTSHYEIAKVRR
ncbi:MAG TPA: hypothetical protein VEW28_01325 [Candidatus Kapabacteria bacterium]|nr:hypothetical protein [Candidatus Kapabacteria bacterium]